MKGSSVDTGGLDGHKEKGFQAGWELPIIHPFQNRRMRGSAQKGDHAGFIGSIGKSTDPFLWHGDDYENGVIRYVTPLEAERFMGLPEGWTLYGVDENIIADGPRYKALGNAIALPCAGYIMGGIAEALNGGGFYA